MPKSQGLIACLLTSLLVIFLVQFVCAQEARCLRSVPLIISQRVDRIIGLRLSEEEEELQGLYLSQHGEEGYYWETPA